ncbi:hypothetical protein [Pelodictyon phaeoclathratiforme]|jgi:hypothetical protein|uniref:Uncharacterized protein n=1 Tax=Pelodictyon phaeoclathratiforme (strain DSM 5477 / BU-1) TaxID=324925 RepID=B4SC45_PELPB|nr:hypothetical protein [Pelodictyon phaeoclathratiforme]ACF44151.1 hypothetical protein Ppha_1933 [Pelodictyon phaeoclathratiforme BU-1]MBV5289288.1 hypothetical protein [Pelodictyon phaeoclathratiforme]
MDDDIVYSALPSKSDEELEKGFVTAIIDQPKLLDELAKQLVTLNLAIPGLYATALKFMGGDDAVVESVPLKQTAMKLQRLGAVVAADG